MNSGRAPAPAIVTALEQRVLFASDGDVITLATARSVLTAAGDGGIQSTLVPGDVRPIESIASEGAGAGADPRGPAGYQLQVRFIDNTLTPSQKAIFNTAADRWEQIIMGELSDITANFGGGVETIDDIRIDANAPAIDGPGGILGQAGPDFIRSSNDLTITGIMQFDSADVADLEADGELDEVILHEMGHVLGLGTLWDPSLRNLISGQGGANPRYTGARAITEYQAIFGVATATIPVENTGGPGTADGHWREGGGAGVAFDRELMTGFLDSGGVNPLSRVTTAQFADLGYASVNVNAFDVFNPTNGGNAYPVIASLTDSPDPSLPNSTVTLTANNVTDSNGTVASVKFFRETNGVHGLQVMLTAGDIQGDLLLGTDTTSGPFSFDASTTGLAVGSYTYYAQATDNQNLVSVSVQTTNSVIAGDAIPPTVTNVYVDSTAWGAAFRTFLATNGLGSVALGLRLPAGADQLDALPLNNINQVRVEFSEPVTVDQGDLAVRGLVVGNYGLSATFTNVGQVATWQFNAPIGRDKVLLDLNADAGGPNPGVTDLIGNRLDGNWTNGGDAFPSGNGTAGDDFRFQINVLPGDIDGNGSVTVADVGILASNFNQTPRGHRQGDLNGDAGVTVADAGIVGTFFGQSLPAGTPAIVDEEGGGSSSSVLFASTPSAAANTEGSTRQLVSVVLAGGDARRRVRR